LEEINPAVGDKFDPNLHECIEPVVGELFESEPEGSSPRVERPVETVVELVAKGYKINGFTLRPARVKVYKNG